MGGRRAHDDTAVPPLAGLRVEIEGGVREEEEEKEGGLEGGGVEEVKEGRIEQEEEKKEEDRAEEMKDEEMKEEEMKENKEEEEEKEQQNWWHREEEENGPDKGAEEEESKSSSIFSTPSPSPVTAEFHSVSPPADSVIAAVENTPQELSPVLPPAEGSVSAVPNTAAAGAAAVVTVAAPAEPPTAMPAEKAPAKQRAGGWRTKIKSRGRHRQRQAAPPRNADELPLRATQNASSRAAGSEGGGGTEGGKAELGEGTNPAGQEAEVAVSQVAVRKKPIRELTPHLVEEMEGEEGTFTLTVFQNNKQV